MKPKKHSLYTAMACLWVLAIVLSAIGVTAPRQAVPVASPEVPSLSVALAAGPVVPMATGLSLGIPLAAGALLLRAASRARRSPPVCPVCASRRGARVGQVGDRRNGYRCHTCGFMWEPSDPIHTDAPHR